MCIHIYICIYIYTYYGVYIYNTYVPIYIYFDIYIHMKSGSVSHSVASDSLWPHRQSQARILEWFAFPTPRDLPDPGIKPAPPGLAGGFFTGWATRETYITILFSYKKRMAHEKNEIMPFVAIWMDLEIIMPSQTKTNKWNHLYVESKKKKIQMNLFTKQK